MFQVLEGWLVEFLFFLPEIKVLHKPTCRLILKKVSISAQCLHTAPHLQYSTHGNEQHQIHEQWWGSLWWDCPHITKYAHQIAAFKLILLDFCHAC